jgi:uncharacterized protein YqfB (UPF0267 family)
MSDIHKICVSCGEEKSVVHFYSDASNRDGYKNSCKVCLRNKKKKVQEEPIDECQMVKGQLIKAIDEKKIEQARSLLDKLESVLEKNNNPPSNTFYVCEFQLKVRGDITANILYIKSFLLLFLAMRRIMIGQDDICISKDKNYRKSKSLLVSLPENVLLNPQEVDNFLDTIYVAEDDAEGFSSFCAHIRSDVINISKIEKSIIKLASNQGEVLNPSSILYSHDGDKWQFQLPDHIKFSPETIKKIVNEIEAMEF